MTRERYQTRTINLASEVQRETMLALIPHLPLDPVKPLEIVIREKPKARGLDANGYYWVRLTEIAEQGWFEGRQYTKAVWHRYATHHIMPAEIVTKDGVTRSKWETGPDGELSVISTTELEKGCFADYTTAVEAFGGELGVHFAENPRERR